MLKKISNKKGFTLIELLVVMAIIAVLVTLIIAAINIARRASRDTARRNNMNSIKATLEEYYAQKKQYPGTNGSWVTVTSLASGDTDLSSLFSDRIRDPLESGTDLQSATTDNVKNRYCYQRITTSTYYLYLTTEAKKKNTVAACSDSVETFGENFSVE